MHLKLYRKLRPVYCEKSILTKNSDCRSQSFLFWVSILFSQYTNTIQKLSQLP